MAYLGAELRKLVVPGVSNRESISLVIILNPILSALGTLAMLFEWLTQQWWLPTASILVCLDISFYGLVLSPMNG